MAHANGGTPGSVVQAERWSPRGVLASLVRGAADAAVRSRAEGVTHDLATRLGVAPMPLFRDLRS